MKKINTFSFKFKSLIVMAIMVLMVGCDSSEDEVTIDAPTGDFTFAVNASNDREVTFTANVQEADSYLWDFGDGTGTSTEQNPTYEYADYGNYPVKLTATNQGGSLETTSDISLSNPEVIVNGSFEDDSNWVTINHYEETNENGTITIANGVALFEESTNTDWKHLGIYQEVTLSEGTYQFEMDVDYADINDVWGEAYLGQTEPVAGSDYGVDQGATQVLIAYNAWDCDNKTYDGEATLTGCDSSEAPGQMTITTAGTYYLLFRSGGGQYGTEGIELDNVSFKKVSE
jgi:PKD repeat protein